MSINIIEAFATANKCYQACALDVRDGGLSSDTVIHILNRK